jgi:hypothetical protein
MVITHPESVMIMNVTSLGDYFTPSGGFIALCHKNCYKSERWNMFPVDKSGHRHLSQRYRYR